MWAALIPIVVELFGAVMDAVMKKCVEDELKLAAAELPEPSTFASEGVAVGALFDEAISNTPRWRRRKREALREAKAAAIQDGKLRTTPLTEAEIRQGCYYAGMARGEM